MEKWELYPAVNAEDPADWRVDYEPKGKRDHPIVAWVYEGKRARLIAAAPDMLAALLEILGDLGGRPGVMHLPSIHTARSAIAKARGQ